MLKHLLKDKRTYSVFASDLIVIAGVLFMNWNPTRMVAFYYADAAVCLLSFIIYMFIIKQVYDVSSLLFGGGFLFLIIYLFFVGIVGLNAGPDFQAKDAFKIFYPYYDFWFFLVCSFTAHTFNLNRFLSYRNTTAMPAFAMYAITIWILVVCLFVVALFFNGIQIPMKVSLILALILIRNYSEYLRYKKFRDIEAEVKNVQES